MSRPDTKRFPQAKAVILILGVLAVGAAGGGACKKSDGPSAEAVAATAVPTPAPSVAAAAGPGAFGKGTIGGTVKLTGKPPEARTVTTPDPFCARLPIKDEEIVV